MGTYEISWSADDIFELAERMEIEGAKFYRRAASFADDPEVANLFSDLAAQEDEHKRTFERIRKQMRRDLKVDDSWDPQGILRMYLQAWVSGQVFDIKASPSDLLSKNDTPEKILNMAIGLEKDSIAYYYGIRSSVPEGEEREWVDLIIQEEMKHIFDLTKERSRFKK